MNSAATIWETALGQLQLEVSKPNFRTWFKDTKGIAFDGELFLVTVPNQFVAEYLEKSQRSLVEKTLIGLTQRSVSVRFQTSWAALPGQGTAVPTRHSEMAALYGFNDRYTFKNFVVGPGNRLAHAAALSAARPTTATSYNPLFIYAEPGLGKTHLLQAIGHQALENNLRPVYVSGEQFTHEFVEAIRERRTEDFRARYRKADMLMVDDIQSLAGKEQTEECFFNTFNELHNAGRQIVITSDRTPKSMGRMAERLKSRFEWGLMVDIQPPEYETRLAILQTRLEQTQTRLMPEVLEMLAQEMRRNIRELEGSLNRILAYARLLGADITPELAAVAVKDVGPGKKEATNPFEVAGVIRAVAASFAVAEEALTGRKRDKDTALARQVAMYLLKEHGSYSLAAAGEALGGRNASTVSHACEKISHDIAASSELRRQLDAICHQLKTGR